MHSEFCTMHSDNENNFNANIVAVYFLIICFKYVHAFQAMNISDIRAQFELIKRGIKRFHMCFGCVLYVVYAILRMNNKHATSHSFFFLRNHDCIWCIWQQDRRCLYWYALNLWMENESHWHCNFINQNFINQNLAIRTYNLRCVSAYNVQYSHVPRAIELFAYFYWNSMRHNKCMHQSPTHMCFLNQFVVQSAAWRLYIFSAVIRKSVATNQHSDGETYLPERTRNASHIRTVDTKLWANSNKPATSIWCMWVCAVCVEEIHLASLEISCCCGLWIVVVRVHMLIRLTANARRHSSLGCD